MNLKLEDLSQYIVLIIFILIIIKVLGEGIVASVHELLTGKKKSDDFDIDNLINRKKTQLNLTPEENLPTDKEINLKRKLENFSDSKEKEELTRVLNSLDWGDIDSSYSKVSQELLDSIDSTKGLSRIVRLFFEKEFSNDLALTLQKWTVIYDNSTLWTNLINRKSQLSDKKALVSFINPNITYINSLNDNSIKVELEKLLQPEVINTVLFKEKAFSEVETKEIFEQFQIKSNLFKSLKPIVPINKVNTKIWALEVLGLDSKISDPEVIKKKYKLVTSKIHPDKFSSLNLNKSEVDILNENLALVNKAYAYLKA